MTILLYVTCGIVILFGFVLAFGAPYLPTRNKQIDAALDLLGLKKGQTLLELGCGDGRVLKVAARRGMYCIGYELNPILALYAWLTTLNQRKNIKIIWGNFWLKPLPPADGIFVFLLDKYMAKLDKKIIQDFDYPIKLASFAFKVPGRRYSIQKNGVYLYEYKQQTKS